MEAQTENAPPYRWVIITSLTALTATHLTIIYTIGILLPDIAEDLDLSPSEQGWLGSSVLLANLFFAIPLSTLLTRFRPWRVVALLSLAVGLFGLLQGWSPILAILLIGRVGSGLGFTAAMAPRALLIQQWSSPRQLPVTNGIWIGGVDLVMGIGFFLIPLVIKLWGWQSTYYFLGGIGLVLAAVWIIVGRERETVEYKKRADSQDTTPLSAIFRHPELWMLALGMTGSMMGNTGFQVFWPRFAEEQLGISLQIIGIALGLSSFAAAPIAFVVNAVPTLLRKQPAVLAVSGIAVTGVYMGLLFATSTPTVLALGFAEGLSRAYFPVLMTMVYQMPGIKPREVGVGLAFMETCIWGGGAIGPLVVGFVEESTGDLRLAIMIISFAPLVLLITSGMLMARRWSPMPQAPPESSALPQEL